MAYLVGALIGFILASLFAALGLLLYQAIVKIPQIEAQVEQLKAAQAKRMPYDTVEGLEDATAILNRLYIERSTQRARDQAVDTLIIRAAETLRLVRGREYNPETPCSDMPVSTRREKGDRKNGKSHD